MIFFLFLYLQLKALSILNSVSYSLIEYSSFIWFILFDYMIWDSLLQNYQIIGIALIILAKLVMIYYERKEIKIDSKKIEHEQT